MSITIENKEYFLHENKSFSQYYNKEGEVLILMNKNYGYGWSTQESGEKQLQLASDVEIIKLFYTYYGKKDKELTDEELLPAKKFFDKYNIKNFHYRNINKLQFHFILKNKTFQIRQYDGLEKIYYYRANDWFTPLQF